MVAPLRGARRGERPRSAAGARRGRRAARLSGIVLRGTKVAGRRPVTGLPCYRIPLETVPAISSAAWITFEFISKARWAVIMLVISLTGSTLELSR